MPPDPSATADGAAPLLLERLIARDRIITIAALIAAIALAWWWLIAQPMTGGGATAMARPGMPPMAGMTVIADVWAPAYVASAFTMWALMMVAMMLPSAAPMILLFTRFTRQRAAGSAMPRIALFVLSYLAVWALFSLFAALLQSALVATGLVSAMALAIGDRRVAAALLLAIAVYQMTGLKQVCLRQCRSPLSFLMRLWRPGAAGAIRLGVIHGVYCLGCCWALMLLLFVSGVMNLAWVAVLALLVLAEKLAPAGARTSQIIAAMLTGGAITLLLRG